MADIDTIMYHDQYEHNASISVNYYLRCQYDTGYCLLKRLEMQNNSYYHNCFSFAI